MRRVRMAASVTLLAAVVGVGAVACSGGDDNKTINASQTAAASPGFRGAIATPAFDKPAMTLLDTSGKPYDIVKETEGQLTLFYLGYTYCPDICPTTAYDLSEALKSLSAEERKKTTVIFVTADPDRDTPEVLRKWLDKFDPTFVGLVPTHEQLDELTTKLRMQKIEKSEQTGSYYTVNHASYIIAFEANNKGRLVYPFGITIADLENDLPKLVRGETS